MKKVLLLVVGIAIAVGILGFFYDYSERSRAAIENNVEFYFTPSIITTSQVQQVTVDVHATSIQPLSAATVLIRYPRNLLVFDKSTTKSEIVESCNGLEETVDVRDVSGQDNVNTIILTRVSKKTDENLPKNAFCVARLFFATKDAGKGKITFESDTVEGWNFDIAGPAGNYFPLLDGPKPKKVDITVEKGQGTPYTYKGFATSDSYTASSLGGLEGADAICMKHAADAGLDGDWFAFLSTTNSEETYSRNAFDRFNHTDVPIYTINGELLAENVERLRSCNGNDTNCIQSAIGVDETGKNLFAISDTNSSDTKVTPASGVTDLNAWTGTLIHMTTNPYPDTKNSCNNWTSNEGKAIIGALYATDKSWVSYDGVSCTEEHRLYCFSYNNSPFPSETTPAPDEVSLPPDKNPTETPDDSANKVGVNFRVKLQGITSQPKNSSPVSIQIKLVEGNKVVNTKQVEFSPQADGAYVANTNYEKIYLNKKYSFLIKGPKHIQKRVCVNSPSENISGTYLCKDSNITFKKGDNTLDFTNIILLSGDLPLQNGIVDAVDIAYVRNFVGRNDPDIVARGDINFDGVVDSQDYTLIINALAFKYDE